MFDLNDEVAAITALTELDNFENKLQTRLSNVYSEYYKNSPNFDDSTYAIIHNDYTLDVMIRYNNTKGLYAENKESIDYNKIVIYGEAYQQVWMHRSDKKPIYTKPVLAKVKTFEYLVSDDELVAEMLKTEQELIKRIKARKIVDICHENVE